MSENVNESKLDLERAVRLIEYKLTQKTFIKAVSPATAKAIGKLLEHLKYVNSRANEALELVDSILLTLYNVERSVKDIIKSLIKVVTQEYRIDLLEIYPYLPSNTKKLIDKFLREAEISGPERAELHIDSEVNTFFNKLYDLLKRLKKLLQELSGIHISK